MLPTSCLKLPGALIKKLTDAGFHYADDLFATNDELLPEVVAILKGFEGAEDDVKNCLLSPKRISANDALQSEKKTLRILTFSYSIDKLLGGGVAVGEVLEVCGAPGSGKTQFCLQLCVSVQLHPSLGGLGAEALYIDTDAGFIPDRIGEIRQGCREHCLNVAKEHKFASNLVKTLEDQRFTDYQYVFVPDYVQLLAVVFTLEDFLKENPKVKLVIIDSITFPFLPMTDLLKRTTLLCRVIQHLKKLATLHNLAVIITNKLTTRISKGEDQLVPALGECVGHLFNRRLMLGFLPLDGNFAGVIYKSPNQQNDSAVFQVTEAGLRDVI